MCHSEEDDQKPPSRGRWIRRKAKTEGVVVLRPHKKPPPQREAARLHVQLKNGLNFVAMAEITGPRKKQLSTVKMPTCPPSRKPITVMKMS